MRRSCEHEVMMLDCPIELIGEHEEGKVPRGNRRSANSYTVVLDNDATSRSPAYPSVRTCYVLVY